MVIDGENGDVPIELADGVVTATQTSVYIKTRCSVDGETAVELGDDEVDPRGLNLAHDGRFAAPTGSISVRTVEWEPVLRLTVPPGDRRIRVWVDRFDEPSRVCVAVT